jgi:acetylglutamate kinase
MAEAAKPFAGRTLVMRVDDATAGAGVESTLVQDVRFLVESQIRPIIVAPGADAARGVVRSINRSANVAVRLGGADAALLPQGPGGIGTVQTDLLDTLLDAGYVPVIEPTTFSPFARDETVALADDVASAIAAAVAAVRAIFFYVGGGVADPETNAIINELTPAEALALADDERLSFELRATIRAAARGVRQGVGAAQILDGRVAHAAIIEMLTAHHLGTQVTGSIAFAS